MAKVTLEEVAQWKKDLDAGKSVYQISKTYKRAYRVVAMKLGVVSKKAAAPKPVTDENIPDTKAPTNG